jgi:CheY-like chemotaxis protein
MGGEVGVESTPGQGSRFWFRLTLPIDGDGVGGTAAEEEAFADVGPLRVLYADDHDNNRALVQAVLATQGHFCDVVCDGAEAVSAAAAGDYDLILMDIQMPGMDGVAAARAIRETSSIPILAVTANTLSEQMDGYRAAGMNDCVAKPVAMAELLAKVARWGAAAAGKSKAAA